MNLFDKIESNIFGHLKFFPRLLRFNVQKREYLTLINCGLNSPLLNIVIDTHLEAWAKSQQKAFPYTSVPQKKQSIWQIIFPFLSSKGSGTSSPRYGEKFVSAYIDKIIDEYAGQPFSWLISPSCDPKWLKPLLLEKGFFLKKTQRALVYDPNKDKAINEERNKLNVVKVEDEDTLWDFIKVIETKDPCFKKFYNNLQFPIRHLNESLFVGYDQKNPVVIAIMYMENETAGIFNLWCKADVQNCETHRSNMARYLTRYAQLKNYEIISMLTSNSVEHHLYDSLGFKEVGSFECLEWHPQKK